MIIGGGITGILCAYFLQKQGVNYVLAEGKTICSGITKNTTAKITCQHGLIYHKLLKCAGEERASQYLKANQEAVRQYCKLCRKIECDFQVKTSYVYSTDQRELLEQEAEALERLGMSQQILDRTGKKGGNWEELREFAQFYYPKAVVVFHWETQDCMSLDQTPYIGEYSRGLPNCYVATGFNKWGMTSVMVAATILTSLIQEKENPYGDVFDPSRNMLKPQLFLNSCEAVKNLLAISHRRCPYLGCALKWNRLEHSWDCPCHGSRFDGKGNLLDNPANGPLKKRATGDSKKVKKLRPQWLSNGFSRQLPGRHWYYKPDVFLPFHHFPDTRRMW